MPAITKEAGDYLVQLLDNNNAPEGNSIRLVADGPALKMTIDSEQEGDTVLSHDERVVLAVEGPIAERIGDATFDVEQTPNGPKLVLK